MELTELLWSEVREVWVYYRRLNPQDALEPGLSGSILAELSLDYGISELSSTLGPIFLLDKNNTLEGYLWRSMNGWD